MSDNVRILIANVDRGILTAAEAVAKEYLSPAERKELAGLLVEDLASEV